MSKRSSQKLFIGHVKQNITCTDTAQQWHQPTQSGRNLVRTDVNQMLNIVTTTIEPNVEVTNYIFDAFSKGK